MNDATLPALAMLLCIAVIPRIAQDFRSLTRVMLGGALVAGALYLLAGRGFGLLPAEWVLLGLILAMLAFTLGAVARAVVLMGQRRGWPTSADAIITALVMGFLVYGFFRIFAGV